MGSISISLALFNVLNEWITRMPTLTSALPFLSLVVAALAVFFGPLIQLFIAKSQIRATVLSANRQRWIDELRQLLAEFVTLAGELNAVARMKMYDGQNTINKTSKMQLCKTKITLMLNPNEDDHQKLLGLLRDAARGIHSAEDEDRTNIPAIIALSQSILKREWVRVKATE